MVRSFTRFYALWRVCAAPAVRRLVWLVVVFSLLAAGAVASPLVSDFEGLPDGPLVVLGDLGLSGAAILTAGVSLNDFDFPPRSGIAVLSDDGGPITIAFGSPIAAVAGYVTYTLPISFQAFDLLGRPAATAISAFANNLATSGDPGSTPNELIEVRFAGGISSLVIAGSVQGGSFALDDLTVHSVPEPASNLLLGAGLLALRLALVLYPRRPRREQ